MKEECFFRLSAGTSVTFSRRYFDRRCVTAAQGLRAVTDSSCLLPVYITSYLVNKPKTSIILLQLHPAGLSTLVFIFNLGNYM